MRESERSQRLEFFSNTIAGLAALMCVIMSDGKDGRTRAANAGLALTYAPMLTELMNQFLKQVRAEPQSEAAVRLQMRPCRRHGTAHD